MTRHGADTVSDDYENRELTVTEKLLRAKSYGEGYRKGWEVGYNEGCASHSTAASGRVLDEALSFAKSVYATSNDRHICGMALSFRNRIEDLRKQGEQR